MGTLPPRPRFSQFPVSFTRTRDPIELRRFAGHVEHEEQLSHLRIAHLTDQHFGRMTPHAVQQAAIDLTNQQEPDLVVISGDFVCHSQEFLDELEETLSLLKAPSVGVLGNHDHWSGAGAVRRALRKAGVEVLDNAHTSITLRNQRLQVVGLDDAYTGHADAAHATKGLRRDLPTIGISHIAEEADHLWELGVPLVFSGHTHAGQITLARMHEIFLGKLIGHKYVHGLYGSRQRQLGPKGAVYVGAGIGAAVMPIRIGERARREVAVFELGARAGAHWEHHSEQPALKGRPPSERTKEKRRRQLEKKKRKHPPEAE
ncbi:MAG: phosphoesterase/phosphatase [Myxococcaceae bacterium]|nr:phosphoesterase/phosphatase [Myxococcaceae bacterium]